MIALFRVANIVCDQGCSSVLKGVMSLGKEPGLVQGETAADLFFFPNPKLVA